MFELVDGQLVSPIQEVPALQQVTISPGSIHEWATKVHLPLLGQLPDRATSRPQEGHPELQLAPLCQVSLLTCSLLQIPVLRLRSSTLGPLAVHQIRRAPGTEA